jgi:hypothetical protein
VRMNGRGDEWSELVTTLRIQKLGSNYNCHKFIFLTHALKVERLSCIMC